MSALPEPFRPFRLQQRATPRWVRVTGALLLPVAVGGGLFMLWDLGRKARAVPSEVGVALAQVFAAWLFLGLVLAIAASTHLALFLDPDLTLLAPMPLSSARLFLLKVRKALHGFPTLLLGTALVAEAFLLGLAGTWSALAAPPILLAPGFGCAALLGVCVAFFRRLMQLCSALFVLPVVAGVLLLFVDGPASDGLSEKLVRSVVVESPLRSYLRLWPGGWLGEALAGRDVPANALRLVLAAAGLAAAAWLIQRTRFTPDLLRHQEARRAPGSEPTKVAAAHEPPPGPLERALVTRLGRARIPGLQLILRSERPLAADLWLRALLLAYALLSTAGWALGLLLGPIAVFGGIGIAWMAASQAIWSGSAIAVAPGSSRNLQAQIVTRTRLLYPHFEVWPIPLEWLLRWWFLVLFVWNVVAVLPAVPLISLLCRIPPVKTLALFGAFVAAAAWILPTMGCAAAARCRRDPHRSTLRTLLVAIGVLAGLLVVVLGGLTLAVLFPPDPRFVKVGGFVCLALFGVLLAASPVLGTLSTLRSERKRWFDIETNPARPV